MARTSLFSTYRQGENRVTASMLAVFERMDVSRLERLLSGATGESTLQLVAFDNQVTSENSPTIPDGLISGAFALYIETKTAVNALTREQLEGHLHHLRGEASILERLLVITPDPEEPSVVSSLSDPRVLWFSFRNLSEAIDGLLDDRSEVISDREQLLLRELQLMFEEDGLLALPSDAVVVAAKVAYGEYLDLNAYVCQPNRSFRPGLQYVGFYRHKRIEEIIPKILAIEPEVEISLESAAGWRSSSEPSGPAIAEVVERLLASNARPEGTSNMIFLLTSPDDGKTIRRPAPIEHLGSGAWTQGQRYTSSDRLSRAATTEELNE